MLFSERVLIRLTLVRVAAMKRVQDLFVAGDAIKAALTPAPMWTCSICGLGRFYCSHDDCCREFYEDYYYRHCPSCGTWLEDVEMD